MRRMEWKHYPSLDEIKEALKDVPAWPGGDVSLAEYWRYIIPLARRRRIGRDQYETIWNPYVTVDGRVRIFADAHVKNQAKWHEEIVEVRREDRFLIVRLRITSDLFGTREDIGTADFSLAEAPPDERERQVDATNPFENAVTSARGRVIAAFGVGVIPGMGLATAEEVQEADRRYQHRSGDKRQPAPQPSQAPKPAPEPKRLEVESKSDSHPTSSHPQSQLNEVQLNNYLRYAIQILNGGQPPENWEELVGPVTEAFAADTGRDADYTQWRAVDASALIKWARDKAKENPDYLSQLTGG